MLIVYYCKYVEQKGYNDMYELGQLLRHRYDGYLNQTYDINQIMVKATDVDRFIQSAISLNEGLFPSDSSDATGTRYSVPVHSLTQEVNKVGLQF